MPRKKRIAKHFDNVRTNKIQSKKLKEDLTEEELTSRKFTRGCKISKFSLDKQIQSDLTEKEENFDNDQCFEAKLVPLQEYAKTNNQFNVHIGA